MTFWGTKTQVMNTWEWAYVRRFCACVHMLNSCVRTLSKNHNFDCIVSPNSKSYNSLNINPNNAKFMFKLKPKISNFQWNKAHYKLFVNQKLWSKQWARVIFQHRFQSDLSTFELWLLSNYCELFNYLYLTYVKLIIGVRDQRLLTGIK